MKRFLLILVIACTFGAGVHAQEFGTLESLLTDAPAGMVPAASAKLQQFRRELGEPTVANDRIFLQTLFKQVHRNFLKKYVAYSEFQDVFTSGNFDCLTATALFSQMLSEYAYRYSLIETNYHIFIVVHTIHGEVLLETTDRIHGFVTDEDEIVERVGGYRRNQLTTAVASDKVMYAYHTDLYRELSADKLPGLLHFNQAIRAFNNTDWIGCVAKLEKAREIYDSPRNEELAALLLRAVWDHEHDESRKKEIISRLRPFIISGNSATGNIPEPSFAGR